jgi:lipopolysaccharide export system permease protein
MLRILDRYVLGIFLSALIVFSVCFMALFLIVDFSTRLPRFLNLQTIQILPFIARYYSIRLPLFLLYVLPTVSLFAAMFSMVKLQKSNEIVPIVTSGTSMQRVALPFVVCAVLIAGGAFALDELVLPGLTDALAETDEILLSRETTQKPAAMDRRGNHITAQQYDHVNKVLTEAIITRCWPNNLTKEVIHANVVRWDRDRDRWIVFGGTISYFDEDGNPITVDDGGRPKLKKEPLPPVGAVLEDFDITPDDLQRRLSISGDFDTVPSLVRKIRVEPTNVRHKLALHNKFSFPLSCVVLLLLGLPFAAQTHIRAGVMRGLMLCLVVTAAYYTVHFILLDRAKRQQIDPVVASWFATALFGALGIAHYARMKS